MSWRFVCRLLALSIFAVARSTHAQEPKTLSGSWSATALSATWNIGDWGTACGPRPGGGGEPGGSVTITEQGKELTLSGLGRQYTTGECWERYPGLSRVSHSVSGRSWRNVCKTRSGDPRQATLITTLTATDSSISFDETGQYQFVIKGQNCTASVRRTRSFRLVRRDGETPPPPAEPATPPPALESTAEAPARCASAGPPARLEVRPSRKLMRAGETFQFRALVLDAKGCATRTAPIWSVVQPAAAVKQLAPGKIAVAEDAPEGSVELTVSAVGRSVRVVVEIVGKEQYEALLRAGSFNLQGESEEAAVASITTGSVGAGTVATRDRAEQRRTVFIAAIGAAAVLIGVLGVVVSLRQRRARKGRTREAASLPLPPLPPSAPKLLVCPTCREEYPPDALFCPKDGNRLREPEAAGAPHTGGGVCPICGQGFDPEVQFCPEHREALVPAAAYRSMRGAAAPVPTRRICPVCGAQYEGETRFCGADGAELVPIN